MYVLAVRWEIHAGGKYMQKYEKLRSKRECKSYHNKFMRAPIRRVAILALQTNIHSLVAYCMTQQREGREEIRPAQEENTYTASTSAYQQKALRERPRMPTTRRQGD